LAWPAAGPEPYGVAVGLLQPLIIEPPPIMEGAFRIIEGPLLIIGEALSMTSSHREAQGIPDIHGALDGAALDGRAPAP
jgi:hypothetical protein